MSVVDAIARI